MKINYNVSAMIAHRSLTTNDNSLSTSLERLSSGNKINHAKDNASGLAMAKRMNAQLRSLDTASQNASDGISAIEIAEGTLQEIEDMVQRLSELAVKASNGTLSDDDRKYINEEVEQLKDEIERISNSTMYNGEVLLDGSFDYKGYSDNIDIKVTTYSDKVRSGDYKIDAMDIVLDADGNIDPDNSTVTLGDGFPVNPPTSVSYLRDSVLITNDAGFEMELQVRDAVSLTSTADKAALTIDVTGIGAMGLQIGTNEGQMLDVRIPAVNLRTLGLENTDVLTEENAKSFIDSVKGALDYVNKSRSNLGAYQNRLEYTTSTLALSNENITAAYSRIMDTDMSEEMTEYSKNQVLVQAGTSMLAQANERPSQILQLLQ